MIMPAVLRSLATSPLAHTCFWVPLEAPSQIRDSCALLGFYAASNCSFVQTFRDNLSILSSSVKQTKYPFSWIVGPLKVGPIVCPETSVRNCHFVLRKIRKEGNFIYTPAEASNDKHVRVSKYRLVNAKRTYCSIGFACGTSYSTSGTQVPLTANWYTATPCIPQLHSRHRNKYMLLSVLTRVHQA
jgi:hypothetical protein